jgi:hypothetical protein
MSREIVQKIVIALKALMTGYMGDAEDAIAALEAELAKPEPFTFVCPTCKADRTKENCKGDLRNCWLKGQAHAELAKPEQEPCGWVNELGVFSKSYPTDFVHSWKPVYASPFNITLMAGKSK